MRVTWIALIVVLVVLVVGGVVWLANTPPGRSAGPTQPPAAPPDANSPLLRIALIPERDIFRLRKRYQPLAEHLSVRLKRPVRLVTVHTYEAVLLDFAEKKIEGAFLGSLVAALAMDRLGARVLVKPELPGQVSTYRGVLFVRDDSPIRKPADLAGHTIAMVRTTTAGDLYPCWLLKQEGLLGQPTAPRFVWVGTHDDVVSAVVNGQVDVGAVKDLRLDAQLRANPSWKVRRLATGEAVPNNALVVRADVAEALGGRLSEILLKLAGDPAGRRALAAMDATRFVPCRAEEYAAIYDMTEKLGADWKLVGIEGPPPTRPGAQP